MTGQDLANTYTYDANGNMTCRVEDGVTYVQEYNAENRISSIQKLASGDCDDDPLVIDTQWDFAYDGDGTRAATLTTPYESGVPQTAVLTAYYFGGAYEVTGSDVKKYYSFGGQSILRDEDGLQYFLTDHLGSVVGITDDAGTLISEQRYLPFGGVRQLGGSFITQTDYGYTGQRDLGMGLMDYKARFYNPYITRFSQPDTIVPDPYNPQSLNRYSYVRNNPIKYTDPSGHMAWEGDSGGCNDVMKCIQEKQDQVIHDSQEQEKKCNSGNYNYCSGDPVEIIAFSAIMLTGGAAVEAFILGGGAFAAGEAVLWKAASACSLSWFCWRAIGAAGAAGAAGGASAQNPAASSAPQTTAITRYYPLNRGYWAEATKFKLTVGDFIGRRGPDTGHYFAPAGTPAWQLSLRPDLLTAPENVFQVMKPLPVYGGSVAPWFGQPGGGIQYYSMFSQEWLVRNGYIVPIP